MHHIFSTFYGSARSFSEATSGFIALIFALGGDFGDLVYFGEIYFYWTCYFYGEAFLFGDDYFLYLGEFSLFMVTSDFYFFSGWSSYGIYTT